MLAMIYHDFHQSPRIERLPDPICLPDAAILKVQATGVCRSDWHGWTGHDDSISLPHVPGHEFAGEIVEIGSQVSRFSIGQRVTAPFVCGCGECEYCDQGDQQVCPFQTQPGFTHWGSFAEYVQVHQADVNLVRLPEEVSAAAAASLGCRFATAFRAVVDQGQLKPGESIAIFGCGGVGLSAIQIAHALDARVIAIDIAAATLKKAKTLGADDVLNAMDFAAEDLPATIREMTAGGVHVAVDALGTTQTLQQSVASLRKRGRHLQIGLLLAEHARPAVPMGRVIADELQLFGCHGMQAHRYPAMFELIQRQQIPLETLIEQRISLSEAVEHLPKMSTSSPLGMTVIDRMV